MAGPKIRYIPDILEEHAEETAFLWVLRADALCQPHYTLAALADLDCRIEAHLSGLRANPDAGWDFCRQQLEEFGEAGEVFAAAVMAFESGDDERIQLVLETGTADPGLYKGLISALGWLQKEKAEPHIHTLLESETPERRHIGIAAAAVHRIDPGKALRQAIQDDELLLRARALRAAGELGRLDLLSYVRQNLEEEDESCRYWAAWTAVLLRRDDQALRMLRVMSLENGQFGEAAMHLVLRADEAAMRRKLMGKLKDNPDLRRTAAAAVGVLGEPESVPWLIEQMHDKTAARRAGQAFTMLTGVDLILEKMEVEEEPLEAEEDEDEETDPDENLPWPDAKLIAAWWDKNSGKFMQRTRYLLGDTISEEWLESILQTGLQPHRAAAALELALLNSDKGLIEVRAPGFRQQSSQHSVSE